MQKRKLCVDINVITFAPAIINLPDFEDDYPLCNENNLADTISMDFHADLPHLIFAIK